MYVQFPDGEREYVGDPFATGPRTQAAAKSFPELEAEGLLGHELEHLCSSCLAKVSLDPEKDRVACRSCGSPALTKLFDLAGVDCPRCGEGTMERHDIGVT